MRAIDLAHPAGAEARQNGVPANRVTGHEHVGSRRRSMGAHFHGRRLPKLFSRLVVSQQRVNLRSQRPVICTDLGEKGGPVRLRSRERVLKDTVDLPPSLRRHLCHYSSARAEASPLPRVKTVARSECPGRSRRSSR